MKKAYTKPEILFEDFSLSVNIASNCQRKTSLPSSEAGCGIDVSGGRGPEKIVFAEHSSCVFDEAPGDYNTTCYDVPFDYANFFNS